MRENETYKGKTHDFANYLKYMHAQVEELCTNYGKIDIFWFDFSYDDMKGEKWEATKLVRMIRRYFPDVLIDNRLEGSGSEQGSHLSEENPSEYAGDFICPEHAIPLEIPRNAKGKPVLWESCVTMNNNWGYHAEDKNYKPADMLIKKLVECVSKGGNLLLNVGPDAKGCIPAESLKILNIIAAWMKPNGESIYGCTYAEIPKPDYGRVTRKGNILYYHIMENQIGGIPLIGVKPEQIKRIWHVATGAEIKPFESWFHHPDYVNIRFGESPLLPDPTDTVVGVELYG